jgi:glycosyltransferase involved in cell wall biosynthesis
MKNKTLAILSLWRNSVNYLERTLTTFEQLEKSMAEQNINVVYSFFENDSDDETPFLLLKWLKKRRGIFLSERINAPRWGSVPSIERVLYQARYRNLALAPLTNYYNFDYLLVVDSDIHWEPSLVLGMIQRLDDNESWGMVSPNTTQNVRDYVEDTDRPSYFDSWALKDRDNNQCLTFAANPFLRADDRALWETDQPVECNSAFGSIALVKAEALCGKEDVEWSVIDGVEHWEFCAGIRSNGYKVIADPTLTAQVIHKKDVIPHPEILKMQQNRLHQFFAQPLAKSMS